MTDATKGAAPEPTSLSAGDLLREIPKNWYKLNRGFRVAIVLISTIVLWEVSVIVFDVKEFLVPKPTVVGAMMFDDPLWICSHTRGIRFSKRLLALFSRSSLGLSLLS